MTTNLANMNLLLESINKIDTSNVHDKELNNDSKNFTDILNEKIDKTINTIDKLMHKAKEAETNKKNSTDIDSAVTETLNEVVPEILPELMPKDNKSADEEDIAEILTGNENSTDEIIAENLLLSPDTIMLLQSQKNEQSSLIQPAETSIEKNIDIEIIKEDIIVEEEMQQTEEIEIADELQKNINDEKNVNDVFDKEILDDLNIELANADTDSADSNSLMQKQSPEEYGIKAILNKDTEVFDINLPKVNSANSAVKAPEANSEKLIEQILKQIDSLKAGSKVNIVLNPESLGKVNIQLINSKDGLTAHLTVTTNEAKELLMKSIDGLKDNLLTNGINIDNLSIKVAQTEKESYNQDFTEKEGSRGGNKEERNPEKNNDEKELFEKAFEKQLENEETEV